MFKSIKYIVLIFVFTACAVGPDYKVPELKSFDALTKQSLDKENEIVHLWWKNFNDPILNDLIIKATKSNLDIKTAYLNIKKARLSLNITEDDFNPDISLGVDAQRAKNSENGSSYPQGSIGNNYQLGINATWEIDLFGRIERLVESSSARLEADTFMYQDILVSLKAEVASTYIEIRNLEDRIKVAKKNILIQNDFLKLTQNLKNAGTASKLDVLRAHTNLLITKSNLPTFQANKNSFIQKLSILLNTTDIKINKYINVNESFIPQSKDDIINLSTNMLRKRPDVRLKERNLAAQTAIIGVATSALYPNLTLGGFLGYNSLQSSSLLDPESQLWNIGGSFFFSLFNRDTIKSNIKIEETKTQIALNDYKKTVLQAISEVNSNISFYKNEKIKNKYLQKAYELNFEAVTLSKLRYENGLSNFQEVLDSQRQLFSSSDMLSQSNSAISLYYVKIYKSLGAGWKTTINEKTEVKNKK